MKRISIICGIILVIGVAIAVYFFACRNTDSTDANTNKTQTTTTTTLTTTTSATPTTTATTPKTPEKTTTPTTTITTTTTPPTTTQTTTPTTVATTKATEPPVTQPPQTQPPQTQPPAPQPTDGRTKKVINGVEWILCRPEYLSGINFNVWYPTADNALNYNQAGIYCGEDSAVICYDEDYMPSGFSDVYITEVSSLAEKSGLTHYKTQTDYFLEKYWYTYIYTQ
jgi:hypothetical protein